MELLLNRYQQGDCWLGTLSVDGVQTYYTLDPGDISPGVYSLSKYFSPHAQTDRLLVNGVPGHSYIEIHVGNSPADTAGCVLVGYGVGGVDYIVTSALAIADLYGKTFPILDAGGSVNLTVTENAGPSVTPVLLAPSGVIPIAVALLFAAFFIG